MFVLAAIAVMIAMLLAIIRLIMGPTIYDRILATNVFATKSLLLIAVLGFLFGQPEMLLDIALLYALIGFVTAIAVMKFFKFAHLGHPHSKNLGDL